MPFWGLSLIGTCVLYLGPLVYIQNREAIDSGLEHVGGVVSAQATQIKNLTAEHTGKATESIKSYAGEYTSKAQGYINARKPDTVSPNDFPVAPKQEPVAEPAVPEQEPLLAH